MSVVRFENVTKRYRVVRQRPFLAREVLLRLLRRSSQVDYHTALEDVSFELTSGEALGVIGANGSGKSTLLSLVAGTSYPNEGRVTVEGRVGPLLELGAGFHPDLTGYENIYLNASLLGLTRQEVEARVGDIIEFAGIDEYIHVPVQTYSSGMTARLGFAVLAHIDPDVLLVDEALSVGDMHFQKKCEAAMHEFRRRRTTLLLVSHDLDLVARLCDRLIWLDAGRVRAEGEPGEVLELYRGSGGAQDEERG
jgi:ABC-type polysaccharide/polyol phosphate transport system ATPase subunit